MADTFDLADAYKALKVFTSSPVLRSVLVAIDPKAIEQADEAIAGFEDTMARIEASREPEWVVDLYIPFTCVPEGATSSEEAEALARATFAAEGLYDHLLEALGDTVFSRSDSEWRTEVGC